MLRNTLIFVLMGIVLVATTSCGGGSGTGPVFVPVGDLIIENSVFSIFDVTFVEVSGPEFRSYNTFISPGISELVPALTSGSYTVTVGWNDFTTETFFSVPVPQGAAYVLNVLN